MSTEDDLRMGGQAAVALVGLAAARAKQIAEQLIGPRSRLRDDARNRAGVLMEEGKHAAAEVVGALRREAAVIIGDLEHLETALRRAAGEPEAERQEAPVPGRRPAAGKRAPAKKSSSKKAPAKEAPAKTAPVRQASAKKAASKKTSSKKSPTAKSAAKKAQVRKAPAKAAGSRKAGPAAARPARGRARG